MRRASRHRRRSRSRITSSAHGSKGQALAAERRRLHVLCAGNLVLDEVFRVAEFPPPDGKVEAGEYITVGGGCAANAAVAIRRLGASVTYAGPCGTDETGDRILANMTREGIDCGGIVRLRDARSQVS